MRNFDLLRVIWCVGDVFENPSAEMWWILIVRLEKKLELVGHLRKHELNELTQDRPHLHSRFSVPNARFSLNLSLSVACRVTSLLESCPVMNELIIFNCAAA